MCFAFENMLKPLKERSLYNLSEIEDKVAYLLPHWSKLCSTQHRFIF